MRDFAAVLCGISLASIAIGIISQSTFFCLVAGATGFISAICSWTAYLRK